MAIAGGPEADGVEQFLPPKRRKAEAQAGPADPSACRSPPSSCNFHQGETKGTKHPADVAFSMA